MMARSGVGALGKLKFPDVRLDDGRVMAIIGLFSLAVYAFVRGWLTEQNLSLLWPAEALLELVRDFGIAAIVAAAVSLGVEKISRAELKREIGAERSAFLNTIQNIDDDIKRDRLRHFDQSRVEVKEIQENVFRGVFARKLPSAYVDMIMEQLTDIKWYKQSSNVTIDIVPINQGRSANDLIEFRATSSFHFLNIGNEPQNFEQSIYLDVSSDGSEPEITAWKVGDTVLCLDEIAAAKQIVDPSSPVRWFKFPSIVSVRPGEAVHAYYSSSKRRFVRDAATHCLIQPADGIRLTVNHPSDFKVYVDPKTPQTPTEFPQESDGQRVTVEIFEPLLPYFTLEINWRPRQDAGIGV